MFLHLVVFPHTQQQSYHWISLRPDSNPLVFYHSYFHGMYDYPEDLMRGKWCFDRIYLDLTINFVRQSFWAACIKWKKATWHINIFGFQQQFHSLIDTSVETYLWWHPGKLIKSTSNDGHLSTNKLGEDWHRNCLSNPVVSSILYILEYDELNGLELEQDMLEQGQKSIFSASITILASYAKIRNFLFKKSIRSLVLHHYVSST